MYARLCIIYNFFKLISVITLSFKGQVSFGFSYEQNCQASLEELGKERKVEKNSEETGQGHYLLSCQPIKKGDDYFFKYKNIFSNK